MVVRKNIPVLDVPSPGVDVKSSENPVLQFVPSIRSGGFADIGPRRYMEDEHIRIDDLSAHLGSLISFPEPSAFYGVFDGNGGPEAAAYVRKNAIRFFFEDNRNSSRLPLQPLIVRVCLICGTGGWIILQQQ